MRKINNWIELHNEEVEKENAKKEGGSREPYYDTAYDGGDDAEGEAEEAKEIGTKTVDDMPHMDEIESKFIFQDEVNELYTNQPIKVFYIYSAFFTNFMVYMTYCGAMPFMYILGIIHFILGYTCYKFLFFWYNRKAYGFDEQIPMYTIGLMKWGLMLHCLFNCFMYTNKRLMVPEGYNVKMHYRPVTSIGVFLGKRFDTMAYFSVVVVFLTVIIIYIFWRCIIRPCYRCCLDEAARRKQNQDVEEGNGNA